MPSWHTSNSVTSDCRRRDLSDVHEMQPIYQVRRYTEMKQMKTWS